MNSHSKSTRSQLLRVGTFNVHQWTNGNSENTFDDICILLCNANLDILGLQEASRALVPELLSKLGSDQYQVAAKFGGSVILTRLPLVNNSSKLGKGRCCCCSVILPGDSEEHAFSVINVHLDHKKEEKRIRTIVQNLEKEGMPLVDMWMGDFNALTRTDYTEKQWNSIFQVRNRNNWELPVSNLTLSMTSKPTKKKPLYEGLGLQDAYASVPESNRSGPLSTCRFETRIDYVYFNAKRMNAAGWIVATCEHVGSKKCSDHNLVIATFEKHQE